MFTNRHQSGAVLAASQTAKSRTENKGASGADFQDGDEKRGGGKNNKNQKDEEIAAQNDRRKRTSASAARQQNTNQAQ